jgi:hypothetical protein
MKIRSLYHVSTVILTIAATSLHAAAIQSQILPNEPPVSTVQGNTVIQNYPTDYLDQSIQAPPKQQDNKPNQKEGQIPRNRLPQNAVPRKRVSQNKIPRNPLPNNKIPKQGVNRAKIPNNKIERNQIKSNPLTPTKIPNNKLPKTRVQDDRTRPLPK